ncbi:PilZ domain-containing protein [Croceicoccus mobilis]|uniref:PilZ domain-containing protein n=1 Tax=Croceicoccus mobilis TaxID=1703339 RepID=A0A916Z635_9SPHN|nr:PilZ domain-containing protein [Croceicoccus mobilis]GGD75895.1 hypothetical protein GCM10010990_26890 [Croceicoccus mobilis]
MKARENREVVEALCRFRTRAGVAWPVLIEDLTAGGCLLTCIPRSLRCGDRIRVTICDLAPLPATVRWVRKGEAAGLQFDLPLMQSVFHRLLSDLRGMPDPFAGPHGIHRPRQPMVLRV